MASRSFLLEQPLQDYLAAHNPQVDGISAGLIEETRTLGDVSGMQIGSDQAALMAILTKVVRPKFAVEVGTFTGYSALTVAEAMGPDGRLLCCDINAEWTAMGKRYWERAGVADRIELRLGPALDTLNSLPSTQHIDMAFIDADKPGYLGYYEALVPRMRPGGIILIDNVLWSGRVVDDATTEESTMAIRAFNDHVARDSRVNAVILTIGDGLTLARICD